MPPAEPIQTAQGVRFERRKVEASITAPSAAAKNNCTSGLIQSLAIAVLIKNMAARVTKATPTQRNRASVESGECYVVQGRNQYYCINSTHRLHVPPTGGCHGYTNSSSTGVKGKCCCRDVQQTTCLLRYHVVPPGSSRQWLFQVVRSMPVR